MFRKHVYIILIATILSSSQAFAMGVPNKAFAIFLKAVNSHINGNLKAEAFEFLPPSSFVFENVSISDKQGRILISAKQLKGSFSLSDLFSGKLLLNDLEAISPKVMLEIIQGKVMLLDLFQTSESSGSSDIPIKNVLLKNADLFVKINKEKYNFQRLSFSMRDLNTQKQKLKFLDFSSFISVDSISLATQLDGILEIDISQPGGQIPIYLNGILKHFSIPKILLEEESKIEAKVIYSENSIKIIDSQISNTNLDLRMTGDIDTDKNSPNIIAQIQLDHINDILLEAKDLDFKNISLLISINGKLERPIVKASGESGFFDTLVLGDVKLNFDNGQVSGNIKANSKEDLFSLEPFLKTALFLQRPQIEGRLSGTLENPAFRGNFRCERFFANFINSGKCSAEVDFALNSLKISNAVFLASNGMLKFPIVSLNLGTQEIKGSGTIEKVTLDEFFGLSGFKGATDFDGAIQISGKVNDPKIQLNGKISNFYLNELDLGEVKLVSTYGISKPHILQLSTEVSGELGNLYLRASFSSKSEEVNALLEFDKFSSDPLLQVLRPWLNFAKSSITGKVEIKGPISKPDGNLTLELSADQASPDLNLLNVKINGKLSKQKIGFQAKAHVYCQNDDIGPCMPAVPIELKGIGELKNPNDFSIEYNVLLNSKNFENISDFLYRESINLNSNLEVTGVLSKKPNSPITHRGHARVNELVAELPDVLPLRLLEPFEIKWEQSQVRLEPEARFSLADDLLTVSGEFKKGQVIAHLDGKIPIILVRMFSKSFVEASGLAAGTVDISGNFDRPLVNASVKPDKGASLTLRSPRTQIIFESGEVLAKVDPGESSLVRVKVDAIRLNIGDGSAVVDGEIALDLSAKREEDLIKNVNLYLSGKDLTFFTQDISLEGDVDLHMETFSVLHEISGFVLVNSGKITQNFAIDNFQFRPVGKSGSTQSTSELFNHVRANIDLDVSSLDLSSNLIAFEFSGSLAGENLKIVGSPKNPRIYGKIELVNGQMDFPALNFDIPITTINFRNTIGRIIDPVINIKATGELPAGEFGLAENTSVELNIDGGIDQFQLDLKTISGDNSFDRGKLLYLLLNPGFGANPEADLILLKPVTLELEKLISQYTRTRFRIGASLSESDLITKFQWRLNPRFEIEGVTSTDQLFFQEARFRLFLFDHLPVGEELYIEGRFGFDRARENATQGSQTLKLNYRVFEQ